MKKKKSEPLKFTVTFSDEIPTHDEIIKGFMDLAKLACDAGTDKALKSEKYKNDEERAEEKLERNKISRNFLSGLEKRLREGKDFEKLIDKGTAKRKLEKRCQTNLRDSNFAKKLQSIDFIEL